MKIYYITRSYNIDITIDTTCVGIRNDYVTNLRKKYAVTVVTPNYDHDEIVVRDDLILVPSNLQRYDHYFEVFGIYEDYLERWVKQCFDVMKDIITQEDVIFATSGGELACIKLAYMIKKHIGCKMVINFHDPVIYTIVNGKMIGGWKHAPRERLMIKYASNSDYIITSSISYRDILKSKMPEISEKIENIYFGFRGEFITRQKHIRTSRCDGVKLVYAGSMTDAQQAEVFMKLHGNKTGIQIDYVGVPSKTIKELADQYANISLLPQMNRDQYLEYMFDEADVGLVSLAGKEWGACVPSKIYELINLETPILGILPNGDAKDIINSGFGKASNRHDKRQCDRDLDFILNSDNRKVIAEKMHRCKREWSEGHFFRRVYEVIDCLNS